MFVTNFSAKPARCLINFLLSHLFNMEIWAQFPRKEGLGVLNELFARIVLWSASHLVPSTVLEVILDVPDAWLGVIVVAKFGLLG